MVLVRATPAIVTLSAHLSLCLALLYQQVALPHFYISKARGASLPITGAITIRPQSVSKPSFGMPISIAGKLLSTASWQLKEIFDHGPEKMQNDIWAFAGDKLTYTI